MSENRENQFIDEAVQNKIIRGINSLTTKLILANEHLTMEDYAAIERAKEIIKNYVLTSAEIEQYRAWAKEKDKRVKKKPCKACEREWVKPSLEYNGSVTVLTTHFRPSAKTITVEANPLRSNYCQQVYYIRYCPWCGRKLDRDKSRLRLVRQVYDEM